MNNRKIIDNEYVIVKTIQQNKKKGSVYVVQSLENDEQFVMKTTEKHQRMQDNNLQKEAYIMKKMEHPLLIKYSNESQIKDERLGFVNKIDYLLLKYCPIGDLFVLIEKHEELELDSISLSIIQHLILQLADQLLQLHEQDIAHLDIKIENVLIDSEFKVILADLGSAQYKDSFDHSIPCGTPFYMAPEVYKNCHSPYQQSYDPFKADAHSFGIFLFALIFMEFPWQKPCLSDPKYFKFMNNRTQFWQQKEIQLKGKDEYTHILNLMKQLLEPIQQNRLTIKTFIKQLNFNHNQDLNNNNAQYLKKIINSYDSKGSEECINTQQK